ncbi:MAG: hypothetical protein U0232_04460 [Thermomicrobiales bacterium]
MATLWEGCADADSADFHGDHVRSRDGRAAIIDWEQARYGPLYAILPDYFSGMRRWCIAMRWRRWGTDIPRERFLRGFDAASRYVGFKYFGFGVAFWRPGDPPRRREDAMKWINLVVFGRNESGSRAVG